MTIEFFSLPSFSFKGDDHPAKILSQNGVLSKQSRELKARANQTATKQDLELALSKKLVG